MRLFRLLPARSGPSSVTAASSDGPAPPLLFKRVHGRLAGSSNSLARPTPTSMPSSSGAYGCCSEVCKRGNWSCKAKERGGGQALRCLSDHLSARTVSCADKIKLFMISPKQPKQLQFLDNFALASRTNVLTNQPHGRLGFPEDGAVGRCPRPTGRWDWERQKAPSKLGLRPQLE